MNEVPMATFASYIVKPGHLQVRYQLPYPRRHGAILSLEDKCILSRPSAVVPGQLGGVAVAEGVAVLAHPPVRRVAAVGGSADTKWPVIRPSISSRVSTKSPRARPVRRAAAKTSCGSRGSRRGRGPSFVEAHHGAHRSAGRYSLGWGVAGSGVSERMASV